MKKPPRPPVHYSFDIAKAICDRLANGETINAICSRGDPTMPTAGSFMDWVEAYPAVKSLYEKAKVLFVDALVDQALTIVDTALDSSRARNQMAMRQWLATKLLPQKFGDRVQVDVEHKISLTAALENAKNRVLLPDSHTINVTPEESATETETYKNSGPDYKSDAPCPPSDWSDFFGDGGV
jgi:hypothetical protein